jgi:ribonuclease BN (tRNA processing enzyme)
MRKKLLKSQVELLRMKLDKVMQAKLVEKRARDEFQRTLDNIISELGVPKNERDRWGIDNKMQFIQEIKDPKKVSLKTVKKKEK